MTTVAVLPVKSFTAAKSRLSDGLPASVREALAQAMFRDVLSALRATPAVDRILVVTPDPDARDIAGAAGVPSVHDDQRGHNPAAQRGVRDALAAGADRVALVPGDCPALDPSELDALLRRPVAEPSVLVIPDRHGTGTNALVLTPPDALPSSFGPDSCERHLALAREAGIHAEVVPVPSLALDVDTGEDLGALREALDRLETRAGATRALLAELTRSPVR